MASGSMKGITINNEMFWTIVILLMLVVLIAVWILLGSFFVEYTVGHINTQERVCDTFENAPLLGQVQCPR